ncbi:unannotated protein [freshwater metagenome]|uniref:Unannotated protein n=1 Tax=freshwater metagenome TaxID=449393 RepID=A0A6J6EIP8_9ZZZZ
MRKILFSSFGYFNLRHSLASRNSSGKDSAPHLIFLVFATNRNLFWSLPSTSGNASIGRRSFWFARCGCKKIAYFALANPGEFPSKNACHLLFGNGCASTLEESIGGLLGKCLLLCRRLWLEAFFATNINCTALGSALKKASTSSRDGIINLTQEIADTLTKSGNHLARP